MRHLLNQTMIIKRGTVVNDAGTQKETKTLVGSFPCRLDRKSVGGGMRDRQDKAIRVSITKPVIYCMTDVDIQKDDYVTVDSIEYQVDNIPSKEQGYGASHHFYIELSNVE